MTHLKKRELALALLSLSLFLFIPACLTVGPRATQPVQVVYPTVVITQYVTQIVATPTITPTPLPTPNVSPTPDFVNISWDPYAVPIYYPVVGCVASRLHEEDVAFVANDGLSLSTSKDILYAPAVRELEPGEMVRIDKGPWCMSGMLIWKVKTADNESGFVPEGNGETYWLLPLAPDTELVVAKGYNTMDLINYWLKTRGRYKNPGNE